MEFKNILDSNIWIAFFDKNDSLHEKSKNYITGQIIITEYIILEVCTVLLRKQDKETVDLFLELVENNENIEILLSNKKFFEDSVKLFKKLETKKLSFVDVSLLYLAKKYSVFTFDKDLEKEIKKLN